MEGFVWGPSLTNKAIFKFNFLSGRIPLLYISVSEEINFTGTMINMVTEKFVEYISKDVATSSKLYRCISLLEQRILKQNRIYPQEISQQVK